MSRVVTEKVETNMSNMTDYRSFLTSSQNTTDSNEYIYDLEQIELIYFYFTIRVLQSFIGTVENLMLVVCIRRLGFKNQPAYLLITSLAVADIIKCLMVYFNVGLATIDHQRRPRDELWSTLCAVKEGSFVLTGSAVMFNVFFISLDRLVSVTVPLWYIHHVTFRKMWIAVIVAWTLHVFHGITAVPYAYMNAAQSPCEYQYFVPDWLSYYYVLVFAVLFILISIFSFRVFFVAFKRSKLVSPADQELSSSHFSHVPANNTAVSEQKRLKQQNRILEMMMTFLIFFFVMYAPVALVSFFKPDNSPVWYQWLYYICFLIWYTNALINPWLYAWKNPDIRKGYKKILGCV